MFAAAPATEDIEVLRAGYLINGRIGTAMTVETEEIRVVYGRPNIHKQGQITQQKPN